MSWVKLDDALFLNEKMGEASLEALGVYMLSLSYAAHNLTDGTIPVTALHLLRCSPQIAEELCHVDLWEEDGALYYRIHDYLTYNPSRRKVLQDRKKTRDRVTAHRSRKKQKRNAVTTPAPVPVPQEDLSLTEKGLPDPVVEIFDFWRSTFGKNGTTKLTEGRRRAIRARLRQGYTVERIKRAIQGCAGSEFHVQGGHTDLTLICRNGEKLEAFEARPASSQPTRLEDKRERSDYDSTIANRD